MTGRGEEEGCDQQTLCREDIVKTGGLTSSMYSVGQTAEVRGSELIGDDDGDSGGNGNGEGGGG